MYGRMHVAKKRGDARIELATSCTQSRNHTTRPITLITHPWLETEYMTFGISNNIQLSSEGATNIYFAKP